MIFRLIPFLFVFGCSVALNLDPDDPSNLANPCFVTDDNPNGGKDCHPDAYCDLSQGAAEDEGRCVVDAENYVPIYQVIPKIYKNTCLEPASDHCFDPVGTCSLHQREYKRDEQSLPGGGTLYEARFENGARCFYMVAYLQHDRRLPDRFERAWCVNSDRLGHQICTMNDLAQTMAGNIAQYTVAGRAETNDGRIDLKTPIAADASTIAPDPYGWRHSWEPLCDDGSVAVDLRSQNVATATRPETCMNTLVERPEEQCDDGNSDDSDACTNSCQTNKRAEIFWKMLGDYCPAADSTELADWPMDSMGMVTELSGGTDYPTGPWSGDSIPGTGEHLYDFREIDFGWTETMPEFGRGSFSYRVTTAGGSEVRGKLRTMLGRRNELIGYMGALPWRDSHCAPVLTFDLDDWRANNKTRMKAKLRGCGLDTDLQLCEGIAQDCRDR